MATIRKQEPLITEEAKTELVDLLEIFLMPDDDSESLFSSAPSAEQIADFISTSGWVEKWAKPF